MIYPNAAQSTPRSQDGSRSTATDPPGRHRPDFERHSTLPVDPLRLIHPPSRDSPIERHGGLSPPPNPRQLLRALPSALVSGVALPPSGRRRRRTKRLGKQQLEPSHGILAGGTADKG